MPISFNGADGVNALSPNTMENITRAPQHANAAVNIDYPADSFGEPKKKEGSSLLSKALKTLAGAAVIAGTLVAIKKNTKWIEVAMKDGGKEIADGFGNKYIKRPINAVAKHCETAYDWVAGKISGLFNKNKAEKPAGSETPAPETPPSAPVVEAPPATAQAPATPIAEAAPVVAPEIPKA